MSLCMIDGCNKEESGSMGLCKKHYDWDLSVRKAHICSLDGCTRHIYKNELCKVHYNKAHPKTCKAQNCAQTADAAKGYCWRHYQQQRRLGELKYTGELYQGVKNEYAFREDGCYMLFHDRHGRMIDEARIDANDYEKVRNHTWGNTSRNGVVDIICGTLSISLSRYIMDTPDGLVCDHKNGDRRDNRRSNLRNCTQKENMQNRHGASCNNKLGERGISIHKETGLYRVSLMKDNKRYVKYFKTIENAIETRDILLVNLFGEYANISQ